MRVTNPTDMEINRMYLHRIRVRGKKKELNSYRREEKEAKDKEANRRQRVINSAALNNNCLSISVVGWFRYFYAISRLARLINLTARDEL